MVFIPQKYNNFNLRIRMLFNIMIVSVSKFFSQGQIVLGNSTHRTRGGGGYYVTDLVTYSGTNFHITYSWKIRQCQFSYIQCYP